MNEKEIVSPIFEAASDDSSSLNRKSMSLNTEAWKEKWRIQQDFNWELRTGISTGTGRRSMMKPAVEMTKEERKELRRTLREELIKVQGLSSKLEARELQLKRQSHMTGMYPALSDAQVSGNAVRSAGGKEVTSQLVLASPGFNQHDIDFLKQSSFTASHGTPTGAEISCNKRTPKANQLYLNSEFVVGKDKMPPQVKPKGKHGTGNKRGASKVDGGDNKRKLVGMPSKQNAEMMPQCKNILKKLMGHKDGWVFNEPVDAAKLGLSDYHLVIKKPMDLGTIKTKLDRKDYRSPQEFADDVRLCFGNAMTYNPRGNDVHEMADEMQKLFEESWKVISYKLERTNGEEDLWLSNQPTSKLPVIPHARLETDGFSDQFQPKVSKKQTPLNEISVGSKATPAKSKPAAKPKAPAKPKVPAKPQATIKPRAKSKPKREMNYQEKANLSKSLPLLPIEMLEDIIRLMKERNPNMSQQDNEIEVDIDSFDNETLWELDLYVKNCLKSLDKSKKAAEKTCQPMANNRAQNPSKKQKGELREEDINIVDVVPDSSVPAVVAGKTTGYGSRSSSSGSSSSESGSSSGLNLINQIEISTLAVFLISFFWVWGAVGLEDRMEYASDCVACVIINNPWEFGGRFRFWKLLCK